MCWIDVVKVGGVYVDHLVLGKDWLVFAGLVAVRIDAELRFKLVDVPAGRAATSPIKEYSRLTMEGNFNHGNGN